MDNAADRAQQTLRTFDTSVSARVDAIEIPPDLVTRRVEPLLDGVDELSARLVSSLQGMAAVVAESERALGGLLPNLGDRLETAFDEVHHRLAELGSVLAALETDGIRSLGDQMKEARAVALDDLRQMKELAERQHGSTAQFNQRIDALSDHSGGSDHRNHGRSCQARRARKVALAGGRAHRFRSGKGESGPGTALALRTIAPGMATDSDTSGLDIRRANRRGFLMGVTLAELMLVTLFVLLLLLEDFGRLEEDLGGQEAVTAARTLGKEVKKWANELDQPLPEIWRNLIPRPKESPPGIVEENRELKEKLEHLEAQSAGKDWALAEATAKLMDEQSKNETLKAEIAAAKNQLTTSNTDRGLAALALEQEKKRRAELESDLEDARTQIEELKGETAGAKEGGLVLCAYEPPATRGALHGKSVALGTVHLQHDGITLIHTRAGLRNLKVVDKVGDLYDLTDALDQLDSWPVGTKRTFEAFRQWGKEFVRIGDRESKTRQNCRFSMGFYFDDGVDLDVLTGVFEHYFFRQPQNSITREEFQRLVSETTGSDDR